jgi:hypothetical protein
MPEISNTAMVTHGSSRFRAANLEIAFAGVGKVVNLSACMPYHNPQPAQSSNDSRYDSDENQTRSIVHSSSVYAEGASKLQICICSVPYDMDFTIRVLSTVAQAAVKEIAERYANGNVPPATDLDELEAKLLANPEAREHKQ